LLEIDAIRVKGKTEAEVIYAIVGRAGVVKSPNLDLQDHWGHASCLLPQAGIGPAL